MKSLIASITILGLVGMVVGMAVKAADTAPISCTVTPGVISVTVAPTSVAYGAMPLGDNETSGTITATNNGGVTEDLDIIGSDATYDIYAWDIEDTPGTDVYAHKFTPAGGSETPLSETDDDGYKALATDIAAAGTQDFDLTIYTPTAEGTQTQYGDEYSTTVTILATWVE